MFFVVKTPISDCGIFKGVVNFKERGYLETGSGAGNTDEDFELGIPEGYKIPLYWDGELVEELIAKRVANF